MAQVVDTETLDTSDLAGVFKTGLHRLDAIAIFMAKQPSRIRAVLSPKSELIKFRFSCMLIHGHISGHDHNLDVFSARQPLRPRDARRRVLTAGLVGDAALRGGCHVSPRSVIHYSFSLFVRLFGVRFGIYRKRRIAGTNAS